MASFRFKSFEVKNEASALKVGTDAVLLGCAATLPDAAPEMTLRCLDIGTGTGVIALILAQRLSGGGVSFEMVGIDIDGPSAEEAAGNFASSPWGGSLKAVHTSLSDYSDESPLDLIVSNPPYFEASLRNPDGREAAARHTFSLSPAEIFAYASRHLKESGTLALILPSDLESGIIRSAASFGLYPFRILRIKTTASKQPKRIVLEFSFERGVVQEEIIVLMDGPNRSAAYSALTEGFYL